MLALLQMLKMLLESVSVFLSDKPHVLSIQIVGTPALLFGLNDSLSHLLINFDVFHFLSLQLF